MSQGCTSGSSRVAFVPSCTCPVQPRCKRMANATEELLRVGQSGCHALVSSCTSPTHWSQELNAGLSNLLSVDTSMLQRSLYMLEQCGLVRLNATSIQLWTVDVLYLLQWHLLHYMTPHSRRCICRYSTMKKPGSCVRATYPWMRSGMRVHVVYVPSKQLWCRVSPG